MKLLLIAGESLVPTNSGGKVFKMQVIKSLAKNNDVYLYTFIKKDEKEADIQYCKKCFYSKRKTISSIIRSLTLPFSVALRSNRESEKEIRDICYKYSIETIIYLQSFVAHAGHSVRCKKILESENVEYASMKTMASAEKSRLKKLIFRLDAKRLYKFEKKLYSKGIFDGYSFISLQDKETYSKEFSIKKPMFYLKFGTSDNGNRNCDSQSTNFLFLAAQDYLPNTFGSEWLASKVMPTVLKSNRNIKLYLVGKNPPKSLLEYSSDNIIITGAVDDVSEYYDKCKCILIPIFHGGGVKIKLIEASSYKKIILSTTFGAIGSEFTNEDVIIEDNEEAFANTMLKIAKEPDKYENYRNNSYNKFKEVYDQSKIMHEFENFVKSI